MAEPVNPEGFLPRVKVQPEVVPVPVLPQPEIPQPIKPTDQDPEAVMKAYEERLGKNDTLPGKPSGLQGFIQGLLKK
jgi:hypothetical protein